MSLVLAFLLLAPVDLDAALRFSAPAECRMDAPLGAIVEQLHRMDPETYEARPPGPVAVPGFVDPIVPHFERERSVEPNVDIRNVSVTLDLPGLWHGLRVTRLSRHFTEESDVSSLEIQFAEDAGRVRAVLNEAGFRLEPLWEWREIGEGEEEIGMVIGVFPIEGGASLVCATG